MGIRRDSCRDEWGERKYQFEVEVYHERYVMMSGDVIIIDTVNDRIVTVIPVCARNYAHLIEIAQNILRTFLYEDGELK